MRFDRHIGIDYSGAEVPTARMPGLQVYMAAGDTIPQKIQSPAATTGSACNWTREEIATWLIAQTNGTGTFIAGIDHNFSFPISYMQRYSLGTWDQFLADFHQHWPTDQPHTYVESLWENNARIGKPDEFRLTEQWTSSAKSVFAWSGQGRVAHSSHAGIPWLRRIRQQVRKKIHFWPFDGWEVREGKSVLVEVYPAIFKRRYAMENRTDHQQDGYSVARWMAEMDQGLVLDRYFKPPLNDAEQEIADLEGWIFGIT